MKRPDFTKLSRREVKIFVRNSQWALVEHVEMDRIPAIYSYKEDLYDLFVNPEFANFTKHELATVFASLAWDLVAEKREGGKQ